MPTTLTMIGKPGQLPADEAGVLAAHALRAVGGDIFSMSISALSENEAYDITLPQGAPDGFKQSLNTHLDGQPIDFIIQTTEHRRKRLLVADMDSTIITCECIDEIADFAGMKDKVAAITERAMRGEIDFEPALKERLALLEGLPESTLQNVFDERVHLMPGAATLVATMRANGARCALVSGGFTFFTSRVAKLVGFDTNQGNVLEVAEGKLTGHTSGPVLGREAKLAALNDEAKTLGITLEETLGVGDGANDLSMLGAAGLGLAFHAKPKTAAAADAAIEHTDLTALLFAQGYQRTEFVEG